MKFIIHYQNLNIKSNQIKSNQIKSNQIKSNQMKSYIYFSMSDFLSNFL
jgi:hypothetical protein